MPLRGNFWNLLQGPRRKSNTQKSGSGGRSANINYHSSITVYMLLMLKYLFLIHISPLRCKPACLIACWHFYSDASTLQKRNCFLSGMFSSSRVLYLCESPQRCNVTEMGWTVLGQVVLGLRWEIMWPYMVVIGFSMKQHLSF